MPDKILSENLFPVVGVGASAGGLAAFKSLIKAIPEESGMAYILIQHLAPQHESLLPDILQKLTALPVLEIKDNVIVLPGHIYTIPPNKILVANDGLLQLSNRTKGEITNTIDIFFASLAEVHRHHAIGVVLSGTGNDGTRGLQLIQQQGGITIAQDEASATYPAMPLNAANAGVVDYVLPPSEIAAQLLQFVLLGKINPSAAGSSAGTIDEQAMRRILGMVRAWKGIDFTYYKQTTLRRRVLRRQALNKLGNLSAYQGLLLVNKEEQDALFKDLLIPVTAFFRDEHVFEYLCATVFPLLFKNSDPTSPIRIWVAGCATGEEAYSMAICLREFFGEAIAVARIQIFATDISEIAIAKARSGIYQKKDLAGVSEKRKTECFTKMDGSYRINKAIREMCVFAIQNFLKDPPFAKLDIVSCRNVLIYMEPYLQKKAFTTFHYALKSTGILLLGKSETAGQDPTIFHALNQTHKFFSKKALNQHVLPALTKTDGVKAASQKLQQQKATQMRKDDFQQAADKALLQKLASVGVVVNAQFDIVQFRGATAAYLESPPGKATHNILRMAKQGLSFELRNALHKAKVGNERVQKSGIRIDKGNRSADIEIIPLQNTIEPYFLVLFSDTPALHKPAATPSKLRTKKGEQPVLSAEHVLIEQLQKELLQLHEDMRRVTEEQEAANEELQSVNEELLSGSEELQSLNEELETSKEEIQSSNEELTILNQELTERNEQLSDARRYAEAIVSTIHEPLLVLTKELEVRSANACFYEKFALSKDKVEGKLLREIDAGRWNLPQLAERLQKVLPLQSYFERFEMAFEPASGNERVFLLNARQLVNETNKEPLILLAMQDITEHKHFEQQLALQVAQKTKELEEANLLLLQSNENLQQFASIASHDLQEPLRKIKTFAALLQRRFATTMPPEGKEVVEKIKASTDRMSQLITEVLQYSKLSHGAKDFVPTDLHLVLNNVLADLDMLIAETKAVIVYKEPLPPVDAVPLQIHQLFYNLLTNALKFFKAGRAPHITIGWKRLKPAQLTIGGNKNLEFIEIAFRDKGIGFEQQFAAQIFQLFERLHSSDEYNGTGVGLALCQKIVQNHSGEIIAASTPDKGTTFTIRLPVRHS